MKSMNNPTKPIKLYLAGPMSGLPDMNYPEFNRVAALLRAKGYEVFNPAENPEPPCKSWQGYMRMGIAQLVQCDCIAMLADSEDSRGAMLEQEIAFKLEIPVESASFLILCEIDENTIAAAPKMKQSYAR
jgi:nucleoside 2-deoxyribosyltransferase